MARYTEVTKILVINGKPYLDPVQAGMAYSRIIASVLTARSQQTYHARGGEYVGFNWYGTKSRLQKKAYRRVKKIFKNAYIRLNAEVYLEK